jgi:hypothetical protein
MDSDPSNTQWCIALQNEIAELREDNADMRGLIGILQADLDAVKGTMKDPIVQLPPTRGETTMGWVELTDVTSGTENTSCDIITPNGAALPLMINDVARILTDNPDGVIVGCPSVTPATLVPVDESEDAFSVPDVTPVDDEPNDLLDIVNDLIVAPDLDLPAAHYLKPTLAHILIKTGEKIWFFELLKDELVQTPMQVIPFIWFNAAHPNNLSIYYLDRPNKKVAVCNGDTWEIKKFRDVAIELRNRAYEITQNFMKRLDKWKPEIVAQIELNRLDDRLVDHEVKQIDVLFTKHSELVKPYYLNSN